MSEIELRPEVRAFAELMEMRLRENDHKNGWKDEDPCWLLGEARRNLLAVSIQVHGWDKDRPPQTATHSADVANFLMMISDVFGELPSKGGEHVG